VAGELIATNAAALAALSSKTTGDTLTAAEYTTMCAALKEANAATRAANAVYAGPASGSAVAGTFRALAVADIPTLTSAKISDFATAAAAQVTSGAIATALTYTAANAAALSATALTSGTVPDARFPATLPALNGSALTSLTSANLTGALPAISGAALTALTSSALSGALPAISGAALTSLNPSALSSAVAVAKGGTGLTTIASGKLLYASALDTLAALSLGSGLAITSGVLDTVGGGGGASLSVANTWTATQTFAAGTAGADGTGTNGAATDYTISAGRSTGTAAAGRIVWQAASKGGSSGTSQQALREIMSLECDTAVSNDFFVLKPNVSLGSASLGTATAPFYKTVTTNVSARYLRLGDLGGAPQINIDGQDGVAKIGAAVELAWTATDATGTSDATIGRLAAGVAKIGDGSSGYGALACTTLRVTTAVAATTPGSVVKKLEIFDAAGTSLGFVAIYSAIT
jgi:hypothetical protein